MHYFDMKKSKIFWGRAYNPLPGTFPSEERDTYTPHAPSSRRIGVSILAPSASALDNPSLLI